jgi:signal recognition particle subunit SRP54
VGIFSSLGEKLKHVFTKMRNKGKLDAYEIKQAMREIRIALLEADVNFTVVKDFIAKVSEKAVGQEILQSLTATQQVIKIVSDELTELMGGKASKLEVASKPPTVIMMCGLQGAGKTTMCGKLSRMLIKQGKRPMLAACDIYRPAAINQLKVVGRAVNAEVFERGAQNPVKTAKEAIQYAVSRNYDTLIIDTAGRLHINDELMKELENIKKEAGPTEILLTVDAMTGQDAVAVAAEFDKRLSITGVILTKLDGDTRGGAALSIRSVTGKPIKFCGTGEKPDDLEQFHPDRMAGRILGMGDVLTLIEKAQGAVSGEELEKMEKRLRESKFTLDDFLTQFESLGKMGDLSEVMAMMPGMMQPPRGQKPQVDEVKMTRFKAIIRSMTMREREHPESIKSSHRKRIAAGSGTTIQDVNQLLKQFEQTKELMKSFKGGKGDMNFAKLGAPKQKIRYRRG